MILRIGPSNSERAIGTLATETIERASQCFRRDGALILEDIVDAGVVARSREAFHDRYLEFCSKRDDVSKVGEGRFMITVELKPPFNDISLFANPYLLPILGTALDENFVIAAFGVVCALPSAPAQHVHSDGGDLFLRPELDRLLPATAVTVAIPLLEMNAVNGTTMLWLGSHHDRERATTEEGIQPTVREGSCMIWDFRLKHGGTTNQGQLPRPLLYMTYCRAWFLDHINYNNKGYQNQNQRPLVADKEFLSSLSEQHQRLLARAQWD